MDVASLGRGVWPFSVETAMPAVHINLALHAPSDTAFFPLSLPLFFSFCLTHTQTDGVDVATQSNLGFLYKYKHIPAYSAGLICAAVFFFVCHVTSFTHKMNANYCFERGKEEENIIFFLVITTPVSLAIMLFLCFFSSEETAVHKPHFV